MHDSAQTTNTQVTVHDFGSQSIVVETRGLPSRPYRDVQVGVIFQGSDGYVVMTSHDHGVAFDQDGTRDPAVPRWRWQRVALPQFPASRAATQLPGTQRGY